MKTIAPFSDRRQGVAVVMVWLMLSVISAPFAGFSSLDDDLDVKRTGATPWQGYEQPWAQYAKTPTHNQSVPDHGPDGGPGEGNLSEMTSLATLENPVVNWQVFEDSTDSGRGFFEQHQRYRNRGGAMRSRYALPRARIK